MKWKWLIRKENWIQRLIEVLAHSLMKTIKLATALSCKLKFTRSMQGHALFSQGQSSWNHLTPTFDVRYRCAVSQWLKVISMLNSHTNCKANWVLFLPLHILLTESYKRQWGNSEGFAYHFSGNTWHKTQRTV